MLTVRIFFTRYQEKIPNCEADEALEQLPREILDALSLEVFIARLDGVQSNLVYKKVVLSTAGGLDLDNL